MDQSDRSVGVDYTHQLSTPGTGHACRVRRYDTSSSN